VVDLPDKIFCCMPTSRVRFFWLALAVLATGLPACGKRKARMVEAVVSERVSAFQQKQRALCRENLLIEAGELVDSMLLAEAQAALRDSLARTRPGAPPRPVPLPPIDTAVVKPLFDQ
jgi:hypothetical protein